MNYILNIDYPNLNRDTVYTRLQNGNWNSRDGVFSNTQSTTLDVLLHSGNLVSAPNFPQQGDTIFHLTGAGEVKSREWDNDSQFCQGLQSFLGVYATRSEALEAVAGIRELLEENR